MSFDLVREEISINNKVTNDLSQIIIEGDIIVPDNKPDISSVLRVSGVLLVTNEKVSDKRLNFGGELKLNIIYTAKNNDKLVHNMENNLNFEDFVNISQLKENYFAYLDSKISFLEYKVINDRKINIKAVVDITTDITENCDFSYVKSIDNALDMQILSEKFNINNIILNKKDKFVVKEVLNLPSEKPNILELINCNLIISDKELKALDDKVSVKGNIFMTAIYSPENSESIVSIIEYEMPFNGFIDLKGVNENMIVKGNFAVEATDFQIKHDADCENRVLDIETTISVDLKVFNNDQIEIIKDVYSVNKPIDITRKMLKYPEFVCKNKNKNIVKDNISIDDDMNKIMQVLNVWGDLKVDNYYLENEKLNVLGVIDIEIFYIANDDVNPVEVFKTVIPFEQEIEVKNARPNMDFDLDYDIESLIFNLLSENEVEVKCMVLFDVFVTKEREISIISDILDNPLEYAELNDMPSAVIYVIQPEDTFWSIAKKYNTTIDDILTLNEIETDNITAGEKLLILKKCEVSWF